MALYRERIGALSIFSPDASKTHAISTQLQSIVRGIYSSPPAHGAEIVETILQSDTLRNEWTTELETMRLRVLGNRQTLIQALPHLNYLEQQNGLFSMIGLSKETINELKKSHGIYIVSNSRINLAGFTPDNIHIFCDALKTVEQKINYSLIQVFFKTSKIASILSDLAGFS